MKLTEAPERFWRSLGLYVYMYVDAWDNIKYIGKGKGDRCISHLSTKGYDERECHIVARNLEKFEGEEPNFLLESYLIKHNNMKVEGDNLVRGRHHSCFEDVGLTLDLLNGTKISQEEVANHELNYILNTTMDPARKFLESHRGAMSHGLHTPYDLCDEILDAAGLKRPRKREENKREILIFYTAEMAIQLILRNFDRSNITLYTQEECALTRRVCEHLLDIDYLTGDEIMGKQFDVIVGNPPYQAPGESSSRKLWKLFYTQAEKSVKKDGVLAFVTPVSWSGPSRGLEKGNDKDLRRILFGNTMLAYNMDTREFFDVSVHTGYAVLKMDGNKSKSQYIPLNQKTGDILNKVTQSNLPKVKLKRYLDTVWNRGIDRLDNPTATHTVPTMEGAFFKYTNIDDSKLRAKDKIHIPRLIGPTKFYPDQGQWALGYQAEAIILNTGETLNGAMSYFESKLIKFILKEAEWTPYTDYSLISLLPNVGFNTVWGDESLYQLFNLTKTEIKLVEDTVG